MTCRDNLVLRVNKGGVLVFRVMLRDAAKKMPEQQLVNFNGFAPDFLFTIGDSEEGHATHAGLGRVGRATQRPPAWVHPLVV